MKLPGWLALFGYVAMFASGFREPVPSDITGSSIWVYRFGYGLSGAFIGYLAGLAAQAIWKRGSK